MIPRAIAAGCLALGLAFPAVGATITAARYGAPTTRYDHGILGDAIEYGALILTVSGGRTLRVVLPKSRVFEDIAPRLVDVTGDGRPEVMVVETSLFKGASLAIYGLRGKIAQTPYLGRPHRWLAPLGARDLDGDGRIEIAYVEKPHLTKILRIWRLENGGLRLVASRAGLTNHQIGWNFIAGGIRECGSGAEVVTANGNWRRVMVSRLKGRRILSTDIGPYKGLASLKAALACRKP